MSPAVAASPQWGRVFPAEAIPVAHHPTDASNPAAAWQSPVGLGSMCLGASPCPGSTGVPHPHCWLLRRALLMQIPTRHNTNLTMGWCFPASLKVPTLVGTGVVKGKANRDKERGKTDGRVGRKAQRQRCARGGCSPATLPEVQLLGWVPLPQLSLTVPHQDDLPGLPHCCWCPVLPKAQCYAPAATTSPHHPGSG